MVILVIFFRLIGTEHHFSHLSNERSCARSWIPISIITFLFDDCFSKIRQKLPMAVSFHLATTRGSNNTSDSLIPTLETNAETTHHSLHIPASKEWCSLWFPFNETIQIPHSRAFSCIWGELSSRPLLAFTDVGAENLRGEIWDGGNENLIHKRGGQVLQALCVGCLTVAYCFCDTASLASERVIKS